MLAITAGLVCASPAEEVDFLKSKFDKSLEPWTTSSPNSYEIENSHLKIVESSYAAPLAAKFAMKPETPLTVSLDFQTVTDTGDGHEFMMSVKDSSSGKGYSIKACALSTQFGEYGALSGFAAGNYSKPIEAGVTGMALPTLASDGLKTLVLKFNPATQVITLTLDGVSVLSFTGKQHIKSVDTFELSIPSDKGGPARYVDNVVISGTPAK